MCNIWAEQTKAAIRIENCIDNRKNLMLLKMMQFYTLMKPLFKISWFLHSFGVSQQIPHNYSKKRWISVTTGMETRNRYKLKVRKSWVTYPYRVLDTLESSGGGAKVPHPVWNRDKPFLTSKGCMSNDFISIKNWDAFIDKESELVKMFNTHYINIEKKRSGVPPKN